jgi:hypothetical protein
MRRITALVMAGLLPFAVGACGGDDESTSDQPDAATDDGGSPTDDGGGDGGTDADIAAGLVDEDCQFLLAGAFLNPLAAATPGGDADYEESAAQLEAIAEAAPEEIQDAMATLSAGFAELAEVLEDVDMNDPQAFSDPEVQAAFEDLDSVFDEEYEEASATVSEYVDDNCSG